MKRLLVLGVSIFLVLSGYSQMQVLPYLTGQWNPDSLGNQRVVVEVLKSGDGVICDIPWRRRDLNPEDKEILVVAKKDSVLITNRILLDINRENGTIIFEPVQGPGIYFIYYLPYKSTGRNYPTVNYYTPTDEADPDWREIVLENKAKLPKARPLAMEAINDLHSFYPMEVIATENEVSDLAKDAWGKGFMLFPELRDFPIRMWKDIPFRWIDKDHSILKDTICRNEYYAFQIGVWAITQSFDDLKVEFSDLKAAKGNKIPSETLTCFHKGGKDWDQQALYKKVPVEKGDIQALWFGIDIPTDQAPGTYKGNVTVKPVGLPPQTVELEISVEDKILEDRGDSEPWKHSRMRWLNSDIAVDQDIIPPYTPIVVDGNSLQLLGREINLSDGGLPDQINSLFTERMTGLSEDPMAVLNSPMRFSVHDEEGPVSIENGKIRFTNKSDGVVSWTSKMKVKQSSSSANGLIFNIKGQLEFDGFLTYDIEVFSTKESKVNDISFQLPFKEEVVEYMLGLGIKGGFAPDEFTYKWDPFFNCDGPWLGTMNAGIQATFRAENYERPLNTNFYQQKPLNMPPSWFNDGKGGIKLLRKDDSYLLEAFSGERTISTEDTLHFNIHLLITPFRPIDVQKQWHDRYYHSFKPLDTIAQVGANTINVHHATDINPYINYPFITTQEMKDYIDAAHERDILVKIYYTVRELTNKCPEIWALKSLGDEILSYGSGGGYSWLQEHLDDNYIAAWFVPSWKDAAVINSGVSRWHNYYLEGLNWLVNNVGIDGLYIDDVAFDRSVMQRVRKILERGGSSARIDLHSANQFNPRDGYVNSANLYLEHFPYIDRLWFGEYFEYDAGPEYWMTEVAGIPFGLMGEMLQDGGNPWRGMLYGMTARAPWSGDPTPLWKIWDEFGIQNSEMIGYWVDDCPVKTGRNDIPVTVYQKEDKCMIALASWANGPARVKLQIDWEALGLSKEDAVLRIPLVKDFQEAGSIIPDESFKVEMGKGYLIIVEQK